MWYVRTVEYHNLKKKKNELPIDATMWMNLESIMLTVKVKVKSLSRV